MRDIDMKAVLAAAEIRTARVIDRVRDGTATRDERRVYDDSNAFGVAGEMLEDTNAYLRLTDSQACVMSGPNVSAMFHGIARYVSKLEARIAELEKKCGDG